MKRMLTIAVFGGLTGLAVACGTDTREQVDAETAPLASWTQCAREGEPCVFTGTRKVRYGTRMNAVV